MTYCHACGSEVADGARFCGKCGTPLSTGEQTPAAQTIAPAPDQSPSVPQTSANQTVEFITSYFTFYLKGEVSFTSDNVRIKTPNTILGLIPLGHTEEVIDIAQISGASSDFKIKLGQMIFAFFIMLFGVACLTGKGGMPILGIFLILLGIDGILSSIQTTVTIRESSGTTHVISLVAFEKGKAEVIKQRVEKVRHNRLYDTNVRIHANDAADRVVDAIGQLRN